MHEGKEYEAKFAKDGSLRDQASTGNVELECMLQLLQGSIPVDRTKHTRMAAKWKGVSDDDRRPLSQGNSREGRVALPTKSTKDGPGVSTASEHRAPGSTHDERWCVLVRKHASAGPMRNARAVVSGAAISPAWSAVISADARATTRRRCPQCGPGLPMVRAGRRHLAPHGQGWAFALRGTGARVLGRVVGRVAGLHGGLSGADHGVH